MSSIDSTDAGKLATITGAFMNNILHRGMDVQLSRAMTAEEALRLGALYDFLLGPADAGAPVVDGGTALPAQNPPASVYVHAVPDKKSECMIELGEIFSRAAARLSPQKDLSSLIPAELLEADTEDKLDDVGATALARVVRAARAGNKP